MKFCVFNLGTAFIESVLSLLLCLTLDVVYENRYFTTCFETFRNSTTNPFSQCSTTLCSSTVLINYLLQKKRRQHGNNILVKSDLVYLSISRLASAFCRISKIKHGVERHCVSVR
jgi:hypothetical protein